MSEYHCYYLETCIVFRIDTITPCCPGENWEGGAFKTPLIPFEGGDFPIKEFLNMKEKTKNEIKSGTSECFKCPHLTKTDFKKSKYLFNTVVITNFGECNAHCSYCSIINPKNLKYYKNKYQIYNTIKYILDNKLLDPEGIIEWGGGEPTIYKEFDDILNLLREREIKTMVNSNCIKFSDTLFNAINLNNATMQLSLDSGDKVTYINMKILDKFDDIIVNLKKYSLHHPENITLKYIINDKNNEKQSIINFLTLTKNLKITKVNLSPEGSEAFLNKISNKTFKGINIFLDEAYKKNINVNIFYSLFGKNYTRRIIKENLLLNFKKIINKLKNRFLNPNHHM